MREKIEAILDRLRPGLGGTAIALRDVNNGIVEVEIWVPGCAAGMPKDMALEVVEEELKEEIPEIKEVVAI